MRDCLLPERRIIPTLHLIICIPPSQRCPRICTWAGHTLIGPDVLYILLDRLGLALTSKVQRLGGSQKWHSIVCLPYNICLVLIEAKAFDK
jgi:hypothetical protein